MKVYKYWFWEMPQEINSPAVIIDSWAATTNISIILSQRPERLIITNEKKLVESQSLFPDALTIGESNILPKETFARSNFPYDISQGDFKDRIILYMSTNGTKLMEATFAKTKQIVSCSFNNLSAIKNWLIRKNEQEVTIIMAGQMGIEAQEDRVCADILEKELKGDIYSWQMVAREVEKYIKNYYIIPQKYQGSLPYVLDLNAYNIVPVAVRNKQGFLEIKRL